jgi:hypothetical protein
MLNPWLSLSFQAARLGWETQAAVVDQLMRIAGVGTSDQKVGGSVDANEIALAPHDRRAVEADPSPLEAGAPAKSSEHHEVAQRILKIRKARGPGSKRRRSK